MVTSFAASRCVFTGSFNQQLIISPDVRPDDSDVRCPPKNEVIALWPNTRVVNCKYYVSQKLNGFNNKIHYYCILVIIIFKLRARYIQHEFVQSNVSKDKKTTVNTKIGYLPVLRVD